MFLIFIGGQSGSGKTGLSQRLLKKLKKRGRTAQLLNMDDYFCERPEGIDPEEYRRTTNFDTPKQMDFTLLRDHLLQLKQGKAIPKPKFVFKSNRREGSEIVMPSDFIIIEGIFGQFFYKKHFLEELNAISVNVANDRYIDIVKRRIARDVKERNRTEDIVRRQEREFVGPGFFKYTAPSAAGSDDFVVNTNKGTKKEQEKILDAAADQVIKEIYAKRNRLLADTEKPKSSAPNVQEMVAKSHFKAGTLSNPSRFEGAFGGVFGEFNGNYTLAFTNEEQIKRSTLISDLRKYVDRIRIHVNPETHQIDFKYNFWFFKNSRAINREANYYLAKKLLNELLNDWDKPIHEVFNDVEEQRREIIKNRKINESPNFVDRGINSSELNAIFDKARNASGIKLMP